MLHLCFLTPFYSPLIIRGRTPEIIFIDDNQADLPLGRCGDEAINGE
jgi:hypothetical protein